MLSDKEYNIAYIKKYFENNNDSQESKDGNKKSPNNSINFTPILSCFFIFSIPIFFMLALNVFIKIYDFKNKAIEEEENIVLFYQQNEGNNLDNLISNISFNYSDNFLKEIESKYINKNNKQKTRKLDNSLVNNSIIYENINIGKKKKEFIDIVLPLIINKNKKTLAQRNILEDLKKYLIANKTLEKKDQKFLENLALAYSIKTKNRHKIDIIDDLLLCVDIIPNSIVLAQAANESGWGSSRFAKEYNALFGEYTYDSDKGIVPLERNPDKKHLVKFFSSLDKSVDSYFKNINTHYAYSNFREVRNSLRKKDNFFDVYKLVEKLDVYAEDINYVNTISSIIRINQLQNYDNIPSI